MTKSRWSEWKRRVPEKLNSISGVATVGGTAISLASGVLLTGVVATVLGVGGAVLATSAFGYAIYAAIPPPFKKPTDLIGNTVELTELDNIFPPIQRIAFVGPSRSGKTTLKRRLQFQVPLNERTQKATATIISVPTTPLSFLAVLDGGGEKYPQQFKIAEYADYLCLVIDHNISETEASVSEDRLNEITKFMTQIREHLRESGSPKKIWIEILANKHDLWGTLPEIEINKFKVFIENENQKWKDGNYSSDVFYIIHSNNAVDDISRFINKLSTTLS